MFAGVLFLIFVVVIGYLAYRRYGQSAAANAAIADIKSKVNADVDAAKAALKK